MYLDLTPYNGFTGIIQRIRDCRKKMIWEAWVMPARLAKTAGLVAHSVAS